MYYTINKAQAKALNNIYDAVSSVGYYLKHVEDKAEAIRSGLESGNYVPDMDASMAVELQVATTELRKATYMLDYLFPDLPEEMVSGIATKIRLGAAQGEFWDFRAGREIEI